ncbi:diguanylate cyclase [Deinococcus taeanensis]|uniref:diguanylate cyclase domain-containing protein n=1 Tax=Deinococcus taeanensis TaxID=2737050 RepID=UPI001CDCEE7F|nr:diguanylate cyclase [Deinococcus taeanensis]UBV43021.1 diguanylate cyclase [Deinococcus taeanensis]
MNHLEDDLFHLLPLPALRWPMHAPRHATSNRAYTQLFQPGALPAPALTWADGTHQTRLLSLAGERRVCRLNLRTLPNGDRILLIEDVHAYHLDPLTRLPDLKALLLDAAGTHGIATLTALRLPPLQDLRHALGDAAADATLRAAARELARAARGWHGSAFRTGPHEFTLCTPQPLHPDQLLPVQRRLTHALSAVGLRAAHLHAGLADAPHDGATPGELLVCAQRRLQQQRQQDRGGLGTRLKRFLDSDADAFTRTHRMAL